MSCSSLSSCTERTQEGELGSGRMTPTREKAIYRRHPAELVMRNAPVSGDPLGRVVMSERCWEQKAHIPGK